MGLKNEDKSWIAAEIAKAVKGLVSVLESLKNTVAAIDEDVKSLRPSGWRKAAHFLKEWGVLATVFAVPVTLLAIAVALGGIAFTQFNAANQRMKEQARFEALTDERMKSLDRDLLALRALVSSSQPFRPQNQAAAKQLLIDVQSKSVSIPRAAVEQAGSSFLSAANSDPNAWPVGLEFVSYRTKLNSTEVAVATAQQLATTPINPKTIGRYDYMHADGYPDVRMSVGGDVPASVSALMHFISDGPRDNPERGKQVILVEGGGIILDNMRLRHVVIRGATIFYHGGPLIAEDVIFVDCVFKLRDRQQPNVKRLALSVLGGSLDFRS